MSTVLASYPNPLKQVTAATIQVQSPSAGVGTLVISDLLGNEVLSLALGQVNVGKQEFKLTLNRSGVFFARLKVDGELVGPALKLSAE